MAVKFKFPEIIKEVEIKPFTLIHVDCFEKRREILFFIYALFELINKVRDHRIKLIPGIIEHESNILKIKVNDLASAIRNTYYRYIAKLAKEKIGYVPLELPELMLSSEGIEFIEIIVLQRKGNIKLQFKDGKIVSSELWLSSGELLSPERLLTEEIGWIFGRTFLGVEHFKIGTPIYVPIERRYVEIIQEQINIPVNSSIQEAMSNIKKPVQRIALCGLVEDYVDRMVVPVIFTKAFFKKDLRLNKSNLLSLPAFPSLNDSRELLLDNSFKDLIYFCEARTFRIGRGPFFIEDIDAFKSEDSQLMLKFYLESLIEEGYMVCASAHQKAFQDLADILGFEGDNYGVYSLYN